MVIMTLNKSVQSNGFVVMIHIEITGEWLCNIITWTCMINRGALITYRIAIHASYLSLEFQIDSSGY